jgi:hypothetical protein
MLGQLPSLSESVFIALVAPVGQPVKCLMPVMASNTLEGKRCWRNPAHRLHRPLACPPGLIDAK